MEETNKDWLERAREMMGIVSPKTLKEICIEVTGLTTEEGYRLQEIIHQSTPKIFDFDFPIFAESYREALEAKIIKHYFYRQICCEDFEEWQLRLDTRMNEIMPYFNKIYESFDYLVDIMDDVDYERVFNEMNGRAGIENTKSTQSVESNTESNSVNVSNNQSVSKGQTTNHNEKEDIERYSDTPQGQLTGLLNDTYMSNASRNTGEADNTENRNDTTTESANDNRTNKGSGNTITDGSFDTSKNESGHRKYNEKVKGKMSGYHSKPSIVLEYRKAIINVDAQVIDSLKDLFVNLYTPYGEV